MMKIYIIITVMLITSLVSCSKEEIFKYDTDDSALYFDYLTQTPNDMAYVFYRQSEEILTHTIFLQVNVMGSIKDYDRSIKVEQVNVNEENAAVKGVHYVSFDDDELMKQMVVPAHSNTLLLPVVLKYDASLEVKSVDLKIGIVENEHFRARMDEHANYSIVFTAQITEPANWENQWKLTFGVWGPMKMGIMTDVTGITDWIEVIEDQMLLDFYLKKCVERLKDINAERPVTDPLKEPDGTKVSFPTND